MTRPPLLGWHVEQAASLFCATVAQRQASSLCDGATVLKHKLAACATVEIEGEVMKADEFPATVTQARR